MRKKMKKIVCQGYSTVYFDFDVSKLVEKVDTLVLVDDTNSKLNLPKIGVAGVPKETSEKMIVELRNDERAIECTAEDYNYINEKLSR